MTLLTAGFEVSPTGTAIPLTGGVDGFGSNGSNGSGTTFVSDSTVPAAVASGSFAAKITVGSTAALAYRNWAWSGSVVHVRQYIYLTASPNVRFSLWENYSSSSMLSRIRLNTDRRVGIGTGSTVWLTSAAVPLNTLCRIEASVDHAGGVMSLDLYSGNSTTPLAGGSVSVTGLSFSSSAVANVYGGILSTLTNFTFRTDAWGVSDTAPLGPVVSGGTVTGTTAATVSAQATPGTVSAVVGEVVTIAGVTPQVVVQGGVRPVPPVPTEDPGWPPDPYREAIRSGSYAITYLVDAYLGGVPVEGAQGLRPTGGSITDTTKPGVRRVLNLELAAEPGLFDLLSPVGTTLTVTAQITYLNRQSLDVPMGVFDVDDQTLAVHNGRLSLTAPDKWVRIQRARFVGPQWSGAGTLVVDQIAQLIWDALGSAEPVAVSATSTAQVGALLWEKDRDKAILDLAAGIGAWVYFDRNGLCTIADIPVVGSSADWLVDASPSGVLVELDRKRSRQRTYNVVVVESSSTDEPFTTQIAWDSDPNSPTYAGPDPVHQTGSGSTFGVVTYYFDTPLPLGDGGAMNTARTILARTVGLAAQVSAGQAPNPAMDAFAVLDILAPQERRDIPRSLERMVADTLTHPLTLGSLLQIEGRSTRTDDFS